MVILPRRLKKIFKKVRNLETFMNSTGFLRLQHTHAQIQKRENRYTEDIYLSQQHITFYSLTASKYFWAEKLLKLAKIINYI